MTKIYPNASGSGAGILRRECEWQPNLKPSLQVDANNDVNETVANNDVNETVLTVWKKSLLFNCDGFTVFDAKGNLVFRVDNYMYGSKGEIVLMDASGNSLLTIRRKRLWTGGDQWLVFEGEKSENPSYLVRRHANLLKTRCLARVTATHCSSSVLVPSPSRIGERKNDNNNNYSYYKEQVMMYEIEGSYTRRSCAVYDGNRRRVAEIKRKEAMGGVAFGVDVFRLVVREHHIDSALAMSLVILLDQMFGSSNSTSHFPTLICY